MKHKAVIAIISAAIIVEPLTNCSRDKSNTSPSSTTSRPPTAASQSSGTASQGSCRFANPAEIAQASGLPVKEAQDLGPTGDTEGPGCYYADNIANAHSAVVIHLFGGNALDDILSRSQYDPQSIVRDVPGLGQQAKYITATNPGQYGGELFVKATAAQGFSVRTSQESREDSLNTEVSIAKLLIPRM